MKISRQKINISVERQMLTGMITNTSFLKESMWLYKSDLTPTSWVRLVAGWCIRHFEEYEKCPERDVMGYYRVWAAKQQDKQEQRSLSAFMEELSEEYDRGIKFNVDYVLDQVEDLYMQRGLERLADDIKEALLDGDLDGADDYVLDYKKVATPLNEAVDPFADMDKVEEALTEIIKPLFEIPGALGELLNDLFVREGFIAIQAPEKRGKTFMLFAFSLLAHMDRCNVAFFQAGDLSEKQGLIRLHVALGGKSNRKKYCGTFLQPCLDCHRNQIDDCSVKARTCHVGLYDEDDEEHKLDYETATADGYKACTVCHDKGRTKRFVPAYWHEEITVENELGIGEVIRNSKVMKKAVRKKRYKMASYPNSTLTVDEIFRQLDRWETLEGFIPDVLLIDYADIMASTGGNGEFRHGENEKWKQLRSLSQQKKIALITATQSAISAMVKETQDETDFSEDKRKYSHVTGIITLNQTKEEKRDGVMRVGTMYVREGDFDSQQTVTVLQSLRRGQPVLNSYWTRRD